MKSALPKPLRSLLRVAALMLGMIALGLVALGYSIAKAQSPHHPLHRDFYREWKQPGSDKSCCNARVMAWGQEIGRLRAHTGRGPRRSVVGVEPADRLMVADPGASDFARAEPQHLRRTSLLDKGVWRHLLRAAGHGRLGSPILTSLAPAALRGRWALLACLGLTSHPPAGMGEAASG